MSAGVPARSSPGGDLPTETTSGGQIALRARGDCRRRHPGCRAGGQAGTTPTIPGSLQELRALTTRHGVVLIFDEVITGSATRPGARRRTSGHGPTSHARQDRRGGCPAAPLRQAPAMSLLAFRDDPTGPEPAGGAWPGRSTRPALGRRGDRDARAVRRRGLQARANKAGEELRRGITRR